MSTELTLYQSATVIRKHFPTIDRQYDYQQKLSALKLYAKDKQFYVAQLEAEAAMAQTLPDAMKRGDVKAERNGKGQPKYLLSPGDNILHPKTITAWRQVAEIPAEQRGKYYATQDRPTRSGLVRWWRDETLPTPTKPEATGVQVLLADPPWQYDFAETTNREIENQYPTATPDKIASHLEEWGPELADDCVLFMWATAPKLREALTVMEAWGFTYKTHAMWDKERMGMGYWFRGQHELLLVGTRGTFSPPDAERRISSVFRERRDNKHSKKPTCVYDAINRMFPNAIRFEMYQRKPHDGWPGGGNECPST